MTTTMEVQAEKLKGNRKELGTNVKSLSNCNKALSQAHPETNKN